MTFRPMLAASKTPALEDIKYPCLASPKLDGIRSPMWSGRAHSRSMKLIPNKFVQSELFKLELHGLDGELMVEGDFNDVQSAIMSVHGEPDFYLNVFDNFDCKGGFQERYASATAQVSNLNSNRLRMVPHVLCESAEQLLALWEGWIAEGYEGAMVRSLDGPYKYGRSTPKEGYLIKLKKWHDDEGVVCGYEEGQTNMNEAYEGELGQTKRATNAEGMVPSGTLGSLLLSWKDKTIKVGTGFDHAQRKEIFGNQDKYMGQKTTFKYQELTKNGEPRFAVFKGFRYE